MGKYLKEFENHSAYETFTGTSEFILPNVSTCINENDVHYNPYVEPVETRLVCVYNVTQAEIDEGEGGAEIALMHSSYGPDVLASMEVDGVELQEITSTYRFQTAGNHTVKYTLEYPTSIDGSGAFSGCRDNFISVTIPNSVTLIANDTFADCESLTSVTIPDSVTEIGGDAFRGTSWYSSYSANTDNIYGGIVYINDIAYQATNTAAASVTFKDTTTLIADSALINCSNLTTVTIPDSVTKIGWSSFEYCSGLESIIIGSGVTEIGESAFANCYELANITCNATTAPDVSYSVNPVFYSLPEHGTLYVPNGSTGYDAWLEETALGEGWTKVEQ